MNKLKILTVIILILIFILAGWAFHLILNSQYGARNLGGKTEIKVPEGHVVIGANWKGDELWVLSEDTKTGKVTFWESSSFGLVEGSVEFK